MVAKILQNRQQKNVITLHEQEEGRLSQHHEIVCKLKFVISYIIFVVKGDHKVLIYHIVSLGEVTINEKVMKY